MALRGMGNSTLSSSDPHRLFRFRLTGGGEAEASVLGMSSGDGESTGLGTQGKRTGGGGGGGGTADRGGAAGRWTTDSGTSAAVTAGELRSTFD